MKNNRELLSLVTSYIDLQLKMPLAIDQSEPKLYTKSSFKYFKMRNIFQNSNNITYKFFLSLEKDSLIDKKIYSRTEFFTICFNELAKDYSLEELNSEIQFLKLCFLNYTDEVYPYIEFSIDKISKLSFKNKMNDKKLIKMPQK